MTTFFVFIVLKRTYETNFMEQLIWKEPTFRQGSLSGRKPPQGLLLMNLADATKILCLRWSHFLPLHVILQKACQSSIQKKNVKTGDAL